MTESNNRTLPLFDDLEAGARQAGGRNAPGPAAPTRREPADGDRHLRAAVRLSRAMWRFPDHSAEETRAGIAICRHLQALLADRNPTARR